MKYYGILPLYPVNGRGTWLKGFEALTAWQTQHEGIQVDERQPLPDIHYSVKNDKLLTDCIAVTGSGLLISEKALTVIQSLNLPKYLCRPLLIHTKSTVHKYFLFNFDLFEDAVILDKTPFLDYGTNEYAYVDDLAKGLKNGTPTPERGVWLYQSIVDRADLFLFYVNSPYRCFVNDRFVTAIEANKLTGFNYQPVDNWLTVE
jgi:hypothetical protein